MKIVQAAGWFFPNSSGGTEIYVSELAHRLRAAGHDVLIAAPTATGEAARTYTHEGMPVFRYPTAPRPTRAEAQGRVTVRGAERFHAWLAETRPDLVHVHTFVTGMGLAEVRAARRGGARVIATTHAASLGFTCQRGTMMRWGTRLCRGASRATCVACYLDHRGLPWPIGYAAALVPPPVGAIAGALPGAAGTFIGMTDLIARNRSAQRELFDLVERFVVLSDWARDVLVRQGAPPAKVVVNRLGVRFPAQRRPPRRDGPLTVAYLGRFETIKGAADLARAIASLPPTLPIVFEFYGPVRNKADLTAVTRVKALARGGAWVTFGPELDAAGVQALLARVDAVCCPSRVVEGGPTVALEAHAAGVPVIGTDLPALSDIVRDGVSGRLVPPGNWRALAQAFRELAAAPALLDRWRAALGPVRTMDDVTREYLELYRG